MYPSMQSPRLISESAVQRPRLIQTAVFGQEEVRRVRWRDWEREGRGEVWGEGDVPAMGGKRMAMRPRKMSLVHMISVFLALGNRRADVYSVAVCVMMRDRIQSRISETEDTGCHNTLV